MKGIEHIYLENYHQYKIFKEWLEKQPPLIDKYGKEAKLTDMLIPVKEEDFLVNPQPVMYHVSPYVDAYLVKNCPFSIVQENLMGDYGHWTDQMCIDAYKYVCERDERWSRCEASEEDSNCDPDIYFLSKDDFVFENGIPRLKSRKKDEYEKMRDGELYTSPIKTDYTPGTKIKLIEKRDIGPVPEIEFDGWFIALRNEFGISDFSMRYNEYDDVTEGTWDFYEEFVYGVKGSKSYTIVTAIEELESLIPKWKLPVDTHIFATSRALGQEYEFVVEE